MIAFTIAMFWAVLMLGLCFSIQRFRACKSCGARGFRKVQYKNNYYCESKDCEMFISTTDIAVFLKEKGHEKAVQDFTKWIREARQSD